MSIVVRLLWGCPVCESELRVVEERSFSERAWAWFNDGPSVWRRRFACDRCAFSGTDRSFSNLYVSTSSRTIVRRWRDFQFSRRFMPVPRFYASLAAVGAALGVALQLTVGWPWWVTTVAVPIGGWIWAASSVLVSR